MDRADVRVVLFIPVVTLLILGMSWMYDAFNGYPTKAYLASGCFLVFGLATRELKRWT